MKRKSITEFIASTKEWDLLVIGGGASGLGVALDAVSRGLKTLLVEKFDFAKGTSSKSTKLVHGGVRYLQQGNVRLVREALKEREYLLEKAPHNAHLQPFIIPFYSRWMGLYYYIGLKMYDILAGSRSIGKTTWLSRSKAISKLPNMKKKGLRGGILYYDGQFDDARLCMDLVRLISDQGGVCINYCGLEELTKNGSSISGGIIYDSIGKERYTIQAKTVVNATGVFADDVLRMENKDAKRKIIPSRGSHIVLDSSFLGSDNGIMIPKTTDGRVLFAIPWNRKLIVGTTDILSENPEIEPKITDQEIDFILENAGNYFEKKPHRKDIQAVFSGLRPLAAPEEGGGKTKEISRGHKIFRSEGGLVSIIGGKWTTFRKMGEDVLDFINKNGRNYADSTSEHLKIPSPPSEIVVDLEKNNLSEGSIQYFIDEELACTPEDILARRSRSLFLDAEKTLQQARTVTEMMQKIMNEDDHWVESQLNQFKLLTNQFYLPNT